MQVVDSGIRVITTDARRNFIMRAGTKCATFVLAIVATTVAAPIAGIAAASSDQSQVQQTCVTLGSTQSLCQSPGDAEIYDAPPQVDYFPYAGGAT
jgi:hypothetical protein